MAVFIQKCPHCNCELQMQEEWSGMEVNCTFCQNKIIVTQAVFQASPAVAPVAQYGQPQAANENPCPYSGYGIPSYPSAPSSAVIKGPASSGCRFLEIILLVIGILLFSTGLCFSIIVKIVHTESLSWWLSTWNWIRTILALIGCVISIIYFVSQDVRAKRVHWEYLGIVLSFCGLFGFIFGKIIQMF